MCILNDGHGQETLRNIHLPKALYRLVSDPTGMRSRLENCVVFAAAPRTPCEMHFQLSSLFLQPATKKVGLHRFMIAGQRQVKVCDILQSQFALPESRVPECDHQYYFSSERNVSFRLKEDPLIKANRRCSRSCRHVCVVN